MSGEVLAHQPTAIRETLRMRSIAREQQQVRRPGEACGQHEGLRVDRDRLAIGIGAIPGGLDDCTGFRVRHQSTYQRLGDERDLRRLLERVPGEVRRVLRAGGADGIAGVAPLALRATVARNGVLRRRCAPRRDAGGGGELLQLLQVVVHRQRRQRVRLAARIECHGPLLTGNAHPLFRFLVERIEFVVRERPVVTDAIQ